MQDYAWINDQKSHFLNTLTLNTPIIVKGNSYLS